LRLASTGLYAPEGLNIQRAKLIAAPRKPKALRKGAKVAVFAPASPSEQLEVTAGLAELRRLGYEFTPVQFPGSEGYFAGSTPARLDAFVKAARHPEIAALVALRGGYGATYLLDHNLAAQLLEPKCVIGFSDLTSLQTYLWQTCGWVTFHGPMVTAGLNRGADDSHGYDEDSFLQAVGNANSGWEISLLGKSLVKGVAEGPLLGGCLTLLQTTIGTPWELDTTGAILVLEDRAMRPYQVDRALMHLKQAGKFQSLQGVILGEFPDSDPGPKGSPSVQDVCERILSPIGVPIVFGASIGHTQRPMLTLPLGVQARLISSADGRLEILEPAVVQ
jgi:muramoyltetrapeptide carboxypeptidase